MKFLVEWLVYRWETLPSSWCIFRLLDISSYALLCVMIWAWHIMNSSLLIMFLHICIYCAFSDIWLLGYFLIFLAFGFKSCIWHLTDCRMQYLHSVNSSKHLLKHLVSDHFWTYHMSSLDWGQTKYWGWICYRQNISSVVDIVIIFIWNLLLKLLSAQV